MNRILWINRKQAENCIKFLEPKTHAGQIERESRQSFSSIYSQISGNTNFPKNFQLEMELPQSRPFGTEGRKPTHDFLSLYSTHPTVQQDPRPSQGSFLKTHDFLQVGKASAKGESTVEISSSLEKPLPETPPATSVEHILPGGIGTYSISHISYINQKVPKAEIFTVAQASSSERHDENSNCSSYTVSGFTLWEESAVKKGKTGKENAGDHRPNGIEEAVKVGQWPSQSSSDNSYHRNSFNSLSSSQQSRLKSQNFIEMIKSAKGSTMDENLDDEEAYTLKKENSSPIFKGELKVKVDGRNTDQKPNTPRSKHSATEQRRRSKINDRFQMLRGLIPHGDHKRDKASFLLEVIEYIQFLQEKVQKYEVSYQGWNQDAARLMLWRNNQKAVESYADQSLGMNTGSAPALMFSANFDEKKIPISPATPGNTQHPVESDLSAATALTNKAMASPVAPLQQNYFPPVRSGSMAAQLPLRLRSDVDHTASQPQTQLCITRSCTSNETAASSKLKEQELTIENGTINISTAYSQGLLNTLTQALQNSGVDLSHANISVQIDIGKRANSSSVDPSITIKENKAASGNQGTTRSRGRNSEELNQAIKKRKTDKS
ncbi:transcription factor BIM1-like isoform X2 [Mangifera indica]|uniref:transcription factor BIM1-like isoform X2 n=1 Tax=Mangifera indica TaxID=29780 RepID=UPI001CFAE102|nr:transcription factor BIM1-like isoform X2 [Mangifera indica]